jgi:hypothetical protein
MEDDMEDYGMSNHLMTDAAMNELDLAEVRDARAFSRLAEARADEILEDLYDVNNELLAEALEKDLEQEEEEGLPPAPPPKPKHIRMQMQMLQSGIEEADDGPELLDSLPELGE